MQLYVPKVHPQIEGVFFPTQPPPKALMVYWLIPDPALCQTGCVCVCQYIENRFGEKDRNGMAGVRSNMFQEAVNNSILSRIMG